MATWSPAMAPGQRLDSAFALVPCGQNKEFKYSCSGYACACLAGVATLLLYFTICGRGRGGKGELEAGGRRHIFDHGKRR